MANALWRRSRDRRQDDRRATTTLRCGRCAAPRVLAARVGDGGLLRAADDGRCVRRPQSVERGQPAITARDRPALRGRERITGTRLVRCVAAPAIPNRVRISSHFGSPRVSRETHSSRRRCPDDVPVDHGGVRAGAARSVRQRDESGSGPWLRPSA